MSAIIARESQKIMQEAAEDSRNTELHRAAGAGNIERLAVLLKQGLDINGMDSYSRTPLMYAVHCEKIECARLLINQGCNLDSQAYGVCVCMCVCVVEHRCILLALVFYSLCGDCKGVFGYLL